jgi:hypothetical protein
MAHIDLIVDGVAPNGRGAFADVAERGDIVNSTGTFRIVGAPHGTGLLSSRTVALVGIGLPLPDGKWALTQCTLQQFLDAADALKERYGDPRVRLG